MGNDGVVAKLVARLGFEVDKKSQGNVENGLKRIKQQLSGIAALAGVAFATKALVNFTNKTAIAGDVIAKTASQFAMSGEEFQKFSFAAERTGVNVNAVGAFFRQLTRRAGEAANGNKTYRETFKKLGIESVKSGNKLKTTSQLFLEVADGIKNTQDQGERLRLLQAVGDEMGPAMVNLLQGGSEAIHAFGEELDGLGVVSEASLKEFEDYRDAVADLKRVFFFISTQIAVQVTPILRNLIEVFKAVKKAIPDEAFAAFGRVLVVLLGIATTFALYMAATLIPTLVAMVVPFLPLILAVAALALVIEDLWVLFHGGESVIGNFIDSTFGEGSATDAVELLKGAIDLLVIAFNFAKPAIKAVGLYILDFFLGPIRGAITAVKLLGKGFKAIGGGINKVGGIMFDTSGTSEPLFGKQNLGNVGAAVREAGGSTQGNLHSRQSSGGTSSQSAQVAINVETSSNASPQQIQQAVSNGAQQGINKGFLSLRDSQLVSAE